MSQQYKKSSYNVGDKVIWAGMSATVLEKVDYKRVKLHVHKQSGPLTINGESAGMLSSHTVMAMIQDVSYPYPTENPDNGWVWEDID